MQIAILSFFHYFSLMFKKRENVFEIEEGKFLSPKFDDNGLIPVITSDYKTGEILMHGYMNGEASLKKLLKQKKLIIGVDQETQFGIKEKTSGFTQK